MKTRHALTFLVVVAAPLVLGACNSIGGQPSGSQGPASTSTADPNAIYHRTGATDVVLRFEEGGGFVPIGFFATQAPQFTLYGDGTVIFRNTNVAPPVTENGVIPSSPYSITTLSEAEIQDLLRFALIDSRIEVAGPHYTPGNIADAPTATFTFRAGGVDKTVSVEALGFDFPPGADAPIVTALAVLGDRLRDFSPLASGATTWIPDRWRGVLTPDAYNPPIAWPWADLTPADFIESADPDGPRFPIHTLAPADVAALGMTGIEGGFSGLALTGPDGKDYTLALRPLLPDETR